MTLRPDFCVRVGAVRVDRARRGNDRTSDGRWVNGLARGESDASSTVLGMTELLRDAGLVVHARLLCEPTHPEKTRPAYLMAQKLMQE